MFKATSAGLAGLRAQEDPAGVAGSPLDHALWNARDRAGALAAKDAQIADLRTALAGAHELIGALQDQLESAQANCASDAGALEAE